REREREREGEGEGEGERGSPHRSFFFLFSFFPLRRLLHLFSSCPEMASGLLFLLTCSQLLFARLLPFLPFSLSLSLSFSLSLSIRHTHTHTHPHTHTHTHTFLLIESLTTLTVL